MDKWNKTRHFSDTSRHGRTEGCDGDTDKKYKTNISHMAYIITHEIPYLQITD